jgi:hypothetical protein
VVALCERPSKYARPEDYGEHNDHNWSGTTWTGHEYRAAANDSSVNDSGSSHKAMTNECTLFAFDPASAGLFLLVPLHHCRKDDEGREATRGVPESQRQEREWRP